MRVTVAIAAAVLAVATSPAIGVLAQSLSASTAPAVADALSGTWTVDPSIGSFDYAANDFSGSWVGYRVQEELVGLGGAVAVGRTADVGGTLALAGSAITSTEMNADLTTLQSDQSMRDGQLGRQGIQTDQFPTATFVLTEPIELGTLPAEGEEVTATAVGDLTLLGVTQSVSIPPGAVWSGDVIGVAGSLTFRWEDFGMDRPQSMKVVSLADDVTMEFQVFFRKDAATAG
jgi:polyisoprenoid-binding protein YceI